MVEIYFNAQSDNGTLTRGKSSNLQTRGCRPVITIASRPCSITVVEAVSAEPTAVQRPSGTIADGNLDEECGVYRSRIEVVDLADVCLVKW